MFGGVYLHESEKAYFKGTFRNKYYYILSVNSFHDPNHVKSIKEQLDMGLEITDKKALEHLINASLFLNLLYSIIDRNINNGEFVEIYSEWLSDEWKYVWGSPKKTIELSFPVRSSVILRSVSASCNSLGLPLPAAYLILPWLGSLLPVRLRSFHSAEPLCLQHAVWLLSVPGCCL